MTEKELKQAQAQELAETWTKLSERNQGGVANIIKTMALVEKAVQELPPEFQQQAASA